MGLETARQARAEGAELILAARNEERLAAAATEVGARSWKSFDATDAESLKQFFDGLGEPIDHVMASGWRPGRRPGVPFRPAEAGVIAKRARCTLQVPNPGPPAR
jgi:NAD(P)-dependent dehydrogenase (short-subunit alcohol dehydrogenase family)